MDSPGGHVSGVQETGDLIAATNKKLKPVTSFAEGNMASAAYWLGVSSGDVAATSDSTLGSIGVVMVHMDRSKQLENEGIKATVMRAGKYKALVNPFEPLTEEARTELQAQLDSVYEGFVGHVATSLGKPFNTVDQKMAQGREFIGQRAVDVGLAHRISTLGKEMSRLDPNYGVDILNQMNKNRRQA